MTVRVIALPHAPVLSPGYHRLAPGQLANVVTCLEMTGRPPGVTAPGLDLRRFQAEDTDAFRALFKRVGQNWMWFSRLFLAEEKLSAILADDNVESYAVIGNGEAVGLLELDFRAAGECELAFFGLIPEAIGGGLGRKLMNEAIARAWARPINRLWVHTCSFDHPGAFGFYLRSSFKPYAVMIEVHDDPRLTGHLPETAAPHVPLVR